MIMRHKFVVFVFVLIALNSFGQQNKSVQGSLVEYVNPLVGTDSDHALSNGNTYPAIAPVYYTHLTLPTIYSV